MKAILKSNPNYGRDCRYGPKPSPASRRPYLLLCSWLVIAALGFGCVSRRSTPIRTPVPQPGKDLSAPSVTAPRPPQGAWNRLWGRYDFKNRGVKMDGSWNIAYNQYDFASPVSMMAQQGAWIWISVRPALGIEVVRLVLRPDSVWMISRPSKNYWSGTWNQLQKSLQLDLDYQWFEDALLHGHGSLIEGLQIAGIEFPKTGDDSLVFTKGADSSLTKVAVHWGKLPAKIHHLSMQSSRGNLSVDYLQSVEVASAALPAKMSLSLLAPGHKAFLQMHWKTPAVEAVSLPPIKIPADYRKLKLGF